MLSKIVRSLLAIVVVTSGLFLAKSAFAVEQNQNRFINIVNPVRGKDFWSLEKQEPLTAVIAQKQIIDQNGMVATWLLRPDALFDQQVTDYFQNFPKEQELGLFLEVTPTWANQSQVNYHQNIAWHYADSVFLSGYNIKEREILIKTAFFKFKEVFGYYPKSVGAWHIDAHSLALMQEKYGVNGALICADQFLTDSYQIWGGWWGVPYYPSRYNVLIPAQSQKNKIPVVVFQWAERDLVKGYGSGPQESIFSVQANDYLKHNLKTDYFSKLTDVYLYPVEGKFGQITVGLENDNPWASLGQEYENQIKILSTKNIKSVTMNSFADWYQKEIPVLSPQQQISSEDFLNSGDKATWIMSTNGRLGILESNGQKIIRDWRVYNEKWAEPYLEVANKDHQLKMSLPAKIDSVRFPDQQKELTDDPQKLLSQKENLSFETPKIIFFLMGIIFLGFLFWSFHLNRWLTFVLGLGLVSQVVTMIKSGLLYAYGMGFWGPNGHDGIWHLALINNLLIHFPPQNPVFGGQLLLNYHYLFDLFVALTHKLTNLLVINLYFQVFPLIFSGLLGILVFLLVKRLTKNNLSPLLSVFFVYFGGSFGWFFTWFHHQGIGGESMFWANQSISFLINPPFVISLILMLLGFILFLRCQEKPRTRDFWLLVLILGLVIGFKAYGGLIILAGLALATLWEIIFKRKILNLKIFLATLIISLAIFLPNNFGASSLFVWAPFWFPHTMLAFPDRFGWQRLDQARQAYLATHQWFKWLMAEGLALMIFLIGNLGTRIIGLRQFFSWLKSWKKITSFQILFFGCLLASCLPSLFFIQKGNPWNTIQFFYYFMFFFGILAGLGFGEFLLKKKKWLKTILVIIILFLTLPTTYGTLKQYLPYRAPARISFDELEALAFLKSQPKGIVLTYPHNYKLREKIEAPKPLYVYETTAYVSAFAEKETFLEDEMNLEILGVSWQSRRSLEEQFFTTHDEQWARDFLQNNKIKYVYLVGNQKLEVGDTQIGLKKIFENGEVEIYEFRDKIR